MRLEIFLGHRLILRQVLTISKILCSHLLHPLILGLFIITCETTLPLINLLISQYICSFIGSFILHSITSKLKVCFAQIILNLLIYLLAAQNPLWDLTE